MTAQATKTIRSLVPGDVVKLTLTERFLEFEESEGQLGAVFEDVQTGKEHWMHIDFGGSLKVDMVKRVKRRTQRQDFKAGELITGRQLRDVMWRRGTIFSHEFDNHGQWVLRADGRMHSLDYDHSFAFESFVPEFLYKIIYLP